MSISTTKVEQLVDQPAQSSFHNHQDSQDMVEQAVMVQGQLRPMIEALDVKPAERQVGYSGFFDSRSYYGNTTIYEDADLAPFLGPI